MSNVSVVMAAHSMARWPDVQRAVASVRRQSITPEEIVIAIDHNEELFEVATREFGDCHVVHNTSGDRGASGTRNVGAFECHSELMVILDDDTEAHDNWIHELISPLQRHDVCGVGGHIVGNWEDGVAEWFPPEFYWVIGLTYRGMPDEPSFVRNVWTANMAVRTADFQAVDGFRAGFGKKGDVPQPEDTDLCLRIAQHHGGRWWYNPEAVVSHLVPKDRVSFEYFVRRCYGEGLGKAQLDALIAKDNTLDTEADYVKKTLPLGVSRELTTAVSQRDPQAAQRAAAIVVGLGCVATGFVQQKLRLALA